MAHVGFKLTASHSLTARPIGHPNNGCEVGMHEREQPNRQHRERCRFNSTFNDGYIQFEIPGRLLSNGLKQYVEQASQPCQLF